MSCWTDRWKQRLFAIQLSLLSGDLLASSLFIQERTCSKLTCWIYCSGLHGLPQEHDCSELESANRKVALCQKCNNMIMVPDTENWTLEEAVCISIHCINANAALIRIWYMKLERHLESGCNKYVFASTSIVNKQDRICAVEKCRKMQEQKTVSPIRCAGCQKSYCLK